MADVEAVLAASADRVSIASAAFLNPELVSELARRFGTGRVVVAVDVDCNPELPSGCEVCIAGGTKATGADAIAWAKEAEARGAGIILPTSKACDGAKTGYDIPLLQKLKATVKGPIVASGGAGKLEHFLEAARDGGADILLAASVFHFGEIGIPELKAYLAANGVPVQGNP